jgi:hypothetical protein
MGQVDRFLAELAEHPGHVDPFAGSVREMRFGPVDFILPQTGEKHGFLNGGIQADDEKHGFEKI